ncbi:hypothetical protein [Flavobacterium muglaense]|uniref:Uncharacterized protein n=1 Tax=Flavobacterium muglaense TaxID=2764716 RepID=A0A923N0P4_9FLAO|nr:hypothetical protein [Flavobacterium muglaense]MBC5838717.1 hypothetical protein [Flavobacterium muglaense]MBC5845251.1 hypothetical protein [Flavobacterium muglaense]
MKKILNYVTAFLSLIVLSSCGEPDEIVMGSKTITIDNAIQIEAKSSYQLNDVLYVNATFSRYLQEKGFDTLLDIYKSTSSDEYYFNFYLEKKSAYGTWSAIDLGEKLIIQKGKSSNYYGNTAICLLDQVTNLYEFRAGIPLLEKGTYRLNISKTIFPSYSNNSYIAVYIETTINGVDENGRFNFSVD